MTTPDGYAGSLVLPPRSPGVMVGALVRPAEDLRLGDYLAFERDRDQPFRITPVQGDEHGRGHPSVGAPLLPLRDAHDSTNSATTK